MTKPIVHAAGFAAAPVADAKAKAKSQASITIHAPLETVWRLMIDIDRWPEWNKAVAKAQIRGPAEPGSSFDWASGGFRIRSRLEEVVPMERLGWTGRTIGAKARHGWTFSAADAGVVVTTTETFEGWLPTILPGVMQKTLDEALPAWLAALKAAAEKEIEDAPCA